MDNLCPEDTLQKLVSAIQSGSIEPVLEIDKLLEAFPEDARLHFLKGSNLVGQGRLIEAHTSLTRAVEIAPDFYIARFQLGLFQLTSGESDNALKTWARLDMLPEQHHLKLFVQGLRHLVRDEFSECISSLEEGIAINSENPPLNNDMNLLIEQCRSLLEAHGENDVSAEPAENVDSTTSVFLNQFKTKH